MTDLNLAVQQQMDAEIRDATYKGCRLLDSEITLTFEKEGKTYDMRVVADEHPVSITPILRERKVA